MRKTVTVGQVWGIPLKLHINWFLIAALVTWSLAVGFFPQEHPGWEPGSYWMVGILTSILFFGSVLVHELGHARIAQKEGVPVNSITLFIFGGIAHIAHEPETPGSEFRIVIAGPVASLGLGLGFMFFGKLLSFSSEASGAAFYLGQINLLLAVFNLLPGFPLDGGRVLRSLFWKWKGDFIRATRWATHTGLGVAILFILGGVFLMFSGNYFNGLWVALIGWYLGIASRSSYQQITQDEGARVQTGRKQQETIVPSWSFRLQSSSISPPERDPIKAPASMMGAGPFLPNFEKNSSRAPFRPGVDAGINPDTTQYLQDTT
jgi:Zn-dependent protease